MGAVRAALDLRCRTSSCLLEVRCTPNRTGKVLVHTRSGEQRKGSQVVVDALGSLGQCEKAVHWRVRLAVVERKAMGSDTGYRSSNSGERDILL